MSNKEQIAELLNTFDDKQLAHVLAMVKDYRDDLDGVDTEDEEYYEKLHDEYEADPDKGVFVTLEEALARIGLTVEELKQ